MDFEARGFLGGLKLDEIEAANSFLMLRMARIFNCTALVEVLVTGHH